MRKVAFRGHDLSTSEGNHEDSCGNSEDDETPQRSLRGDSARARGKRSEFPERRQRINSNYSLCRLLYLLRRYLHAKKPFTTYINQLEVMTLSMRPSIVSFNATNLCSPSASLVPRTP